MKFNSQIKYFLFGLLFFIQYTSLFSQILKPGFDKEEYRQMLLIALETASGKKAEKPELRPAQFEKIYRSDTVGLKNLWEFWLRNDHKLGVVSIRGTTEEQLSWFANYYMVMFPGKGRLKMDKDRLFRYNLSENPKAAVHAGWLLSLAYLSEDIVNTLKTYYKKGVHEFILTGHSQGGAITYLLTAYLENLKEQQQLPSDMVFKTYCSAAPKPGNLYFAYAYDRVNFLGWRFNVVNTEDWVPETPFSIQTFDDFNEVNPFNDMKEDLGKQPFPKNIVLKAIFNKIKNSGIKTRKLYEKYFGKMMTKYIQEDLKGFEPPIFYPSLNYMRAGTPVVLQPGAGYFKKLPENQSDNFKHHHISSYLLLLDNLDAH